MDLVLRLLAARPLAAMLWPASVSDTLEAFNLAGGELGFAVFSPSRYSLRHGGVSEVLFSGRRGIEHVKKRGQWRTDSSLKLYAKETRVLAEVQKVSANIVTYGAHVRDHLGEYTLGQALPAAPPAVGRRQGLRQQPEP